MPGNNIKYYVCPGREQSGVFEQECQKCGFNHKLFAEEDNDPEYYVTIWTVCQCGDEIEWIIPVNSL